MDERRWESKGYFAKKVPGFSWDSRSELKFSRLFPGITDSFRGQW